MEEGVNDINDDSNEKHDEKKWQNALMTHPLLLLSKVYVIEVMTRLKNMMMKKRQNSHMTLPQLGWRNV